MSALAERVLLVDDDLAVRTSLKFALELEGLAVRVYDSGAALLADEELARSACVVVDDNRPGMNGIKLVERLEERHLHHPIILITSGRARDVPEATVHLDIRDGLEKPLEDDALLDRTHAALASTCPQD